MGQGEISPEEFAELIEAARRVQRKQPGATRFYWADQAVKEVFGERLGVVGKTVPPRSTPLYYRLVSRVESELWRLPDPSLSTPGDSRPGSGGLVPMAQGDLDGHQERLPEGASK